MGNHNRYIEEEQTTQWPNKKFKEASDPKSVSQVCYLTTC
jgi:hypothetical protein